MKRCPQCNSVFSDENIYCLNDGTVLVEENFALPSEADDFEAETIIRNDPVVVDLSDRKTEPIIQRTNPVETIVVKQPAKPKNAVIFLILGLMLGGGLVLATLLLARTFYQTDDNKTVKVNKISNKAEPNSPTPTPLDIDKMSQKHETRTTADDEDFNGRVIALNAFVRASPSRNSDEIDVLPIDDRINIEKREDESSPWFYVTCEHGTSGWMHGNTIEYTR